MKKIKQDYVLFCNHVSTGVSKQLSFIDVYNGIEAKSSDEAFLVGYVVIRLSNLERDSEYGFEFFLENKKTKSHISIGEIKGKVDNDSVNVVYKIKEKQKIPFGGYELGVNIFHGDNQRVLEDLTDLRVVEIA